MPPEKVLEQTLACLRQTRRPLLSSEWDDEISGRTPEEKRSAAETLSKVQKALLSLENTEIASIRDRLRENENALTDGTHKLNEVLTNLQDVKKVIATVNALLQIAARLAPLFA